MGSMSSGLGQGRACPEGADPLSAAPPRLVNTMDMLFDPYADGPFQAASKTAARTKTPAGTGRRRPVPLRAGADGHHGGHGDSHEHGDRGTRTRPGSPARPSS